LLVRYGGEEFVIILPQIDHQGAVELAEVIRLAINDLEIPHKLSAIAHHITLSLGVAVLAPRIEQSPLTLLAAADQALYRAKAAGRNRSILAASEIQQILQ
jgi:diguanylate cyclase (GGDEF)-like protein